MADYLNAILKLFLDPNSVVYWGWLLCFALLGFVIALYSQRSKNGKVDAKSAIRFLLNREVWLSWSAVLDYGIFLINILIITTAINVFIFGSSPEYFFGRKIVQWLSQLFGVGGGATLTHGFWSSALYSFLLIAFGDLGYTIMHLLYHRVPWLWELHKVHHSATTLNIFTFHRTHILQQILDPMSWGIGAGLFAWIASAIFGYFPTVVTVAGINIFLAVSRSMQLFSHSQFGISFGRLEYLFRSPLMHQVHHSVDPKHYGKNLCLIFSFWDWMLGTLYLPQPGERFVYGIKNEVTGSRDKSYESLLAATIHPAVSRWIGRMRGV